MATTVALNSYRKRSANVEELITMPFRDFFTPKHQSGPDYVAPTDAITTTKVTGSIRIHTSENKSYMKEQSLYTCLKNTVDKYPKHIALAALKNGKWCKWTYANYWEEICTAAKGFMKLGLLPFHGVGILGFNSPEWFISHLAAIFAGGLSAGIYTTNSTEACHHVLTDCEANLVVVENEAQLNKILPIRSKLRNLKAIIQYSGKPEHPDVYSWEELMAIGRSLDDKHLDMRIKSLAINHCCVIIYTSGTTGNPKGVMLNHDNMQYFVYNLVTKLWPMNMGKEVFCTYLPLSHIAALASDLYAPIILAGAVYFATPDALKGKLVDLLCDVEPTVMLGVPRVWEKITDKIKEAHDSMTPRKKDLFVWAQKQALAYHLQKNEGNTQKSFGYRLASKLVFSKLKKKLGFHKTKVLLSGGAPLAIEVLKYFLSLDLVINEAYGLSETTGPVFSNTVYNYRIGSVGKLSVMIEGKIDNPDDTGNGEILLRGRPIFMGYLNMEAGTNDVVTKDGWFHTGDIGNLDKDKFLFITGRIKEILITSGGENVAPVPIEDALKNLIPVMSNCMLLGDKRKFLALLVTLKTDINLDTLIPTDVLTPAAQKWCKERGADATTVTEILKAGPDSRVLKGIQDGIDVYNNSLAISNAQKIQKFVILPRDFSLPGDELGPTLKLKRPVVTKKYENYIKDLYSGAE
uniref:long-chain-fatty-acid--CoA ligase n=1 Tax=Strigamia maritima TaxID=126957 RepID=T1ITR4_STRMM